MSERAGALVGKQVRIIQPDGREWRTWMNKCVGVVGTVIEASRYDEVRVSYVNLLTTMDEVMWFPVNCVEPYILAPDGDALQRIRSA